MRVLQANKYFFISGGADLAFFDSINGLRARGHQVSEFARQDARNIPSDYAKYFPPALPPLLSQHSRRVQWRLFKELFRSRDVEKNLTALVRAERPQVAHLHNVYHQLSASIFLTLRRLGLPQALTVHDAFPLCPNHNLLKGETLGEQYFKNKLYNCVRYKCVHGELLPSVAGTLEAYYYRLAGIWRHIDRFICPSEFMKNKMVEYGFPEQKMRVVNYPLTRLPTIVPPLGKNIVFLGRIHYEKGIKIFLRAVRDLRDYSIVIAGNGPEDGWVDDFIKQERLTNVAKINWVTGADWEKVIADARVVVVPSVFFETSGLVALEALAWGRLVVGADRGALPETIIDGETGLLAKPEDPADLARVIREAMSLSDQKAETLIRKGRALVLAEHGLDKYLDGLERVYREVLKT